MQSSPSVLLLDQYRNVTGGQTCFLTEIDAALRHTERVEAWFPLGGSLEQAVREKFGAKIRIKGLAEPALTAGSKTAADILRIVIYCLRFSRNLPLLRRFDIVYVNGSRLFIPVWALSPFTKARYFYHIHLNHSPLEKRVIACIARARRTSQIITNSEFVHQCLIDFAADTEMGGCCRLIENGLSEKFDKIEFEDRFRAELVGSPGIAIIGRISHDKGQDILQTIAPRFPEARFHIFGTVSPENEAFWSSLRTSLPDNVEYHGFTLDLGAEVRRHNIQFSLVPSRWEEPFGLTAIESMALSLVTVVRRRGALGYIADKTGAESFVLDDEAADKLGKLLSSDPASLTNLARIQYTRTIKFFGYERFVSEISECFTN